METKKAMSEMEKLINEIKQKQQTLNTEIESVIKRISKDKSEYIKTLEALELRTATEVYSYPCYKCGQMGSLYSYPTRNVFICSNAFCVSTFTIDYQLFCPGCGNHTMVSYYFDERITAHIRLVTQWNQCSCGWHTDKAYYFYWI